MKKIILTLFCLVNIINLQSQSTVTIGSGGNINGTQETSPINIFYRSHHCQIIYTAAELNTAGWIGQGMITKLGFNIAGSPIYGLPNYTIKLKNTLATDVANDDAFGLNTVLTSAMYSPASGGFELLTLDNSFLWDGTSNLLVDVCFDQVSPTYDQSGQAYTFSYTSGLIEYSFVRSDGAPQCGVPTSTSNTLPNPAEKPQLQLSMFAPAPCSGTPTGGDATSTSTLVCTNATFNINLINGTLATGLEYQWQSSPNGVAWTNLGSVQSTYLYTINSLTATTYYQCVTTCTSSVLSATSTPIVVTLSPLINCYCMPAYSWDCTGDKFSDFSLANVVFQPGNCDLNGYSDSTISTITTINLLAGNTYSLQANIANSGLSGNMTAGAWIDYDQNGVFDASEFTYLGYGGTQIYSSSLSVPITAPSGTVRMRLKLDANYAWAGTTIDPCSNNNSSSYGQILDYKVNITAAPVCSGAPNSGDAISSSTAVCSINSYSLNLINNDLASGITYQWQSSPNGTVWTNLGSVQNTIPYAITSQSTTTYYRCVTECTISALSGISTPVMVSQNLPTACYCVPENISCSSAQITNVLFETINDTPVCSAGTGYTDNAGIISPVSLTSAQNYTISIDINCQGPTGYAGVWIDYNHDGAFDSYEYNDIGNIAVGTLTSNIYVPFTAIGGLTRMRLKMESTWGSFNGLNPCTADQPNGQTLDYLINITPSTPCTGAPNAGDAHAFVSAICENNPFDLDLLNNDYVSDISYQWQSSPDNVIWTNIGSPQTTVPFTINTQTVTTHYRCLTTCTTSALTSTSNPTAITQNPLTNCFCVPPFADCSTNDEINNVIFATLSNTSTCTTSGYEDYSLSVASTTIQAGQTYTIDVTVGSDYNGKVAAWIDYNQNGVFDNSEYTLLGITNSIGDYTVSSSINIPAGALPGNTKMRIRNNYSFMFQDFEACADGGSGARSAAAGPPIGHGETEDYLITVLSPDCSLINYPPSISLTGNTDICAGNSSSLDLSAPLPTSTGITYQWKSYNGTTFINDGAALSTSGFTASPVANTPYFCEILCNGTPVMNSDTIFIKVHTITTAPILSNVTCNATCNGSATLTANDFGGILSYTWTPVVSLGDIATGLCAGNYTVNIENSIGCAITETIVITEPTAMAVTPTQTNVSCFGLNNGSISLSVVGGAGGYIYSWTPGGNTTSSISSLAPNTYTCIILDANSCSATTTISITEPTALVVTPTQSNVSCFGLSDGSASLTVGGGTGTYTYSWLPGLGTTNTETNLPAGTYTYNVSDNNLCTVTQSITITEPTVLTASAAQTNVSCFGSSNGSASITVGGGTGTYSYNWAPNVGSSDIVSGLTANSYTCIIMDDNLCSSTQTLMITEPSALSATPSQTNLICNGLNNGTASVTVNGGTGSLNFSWSPFGGTSSTANNLTAGNYTCSIIDANLCSLSQTFTITQPIAMSVSITGTNTICEQLKDSITSSITGGAGPFLYSWTELPGTVVSTNTYYTYTTAIGTHSYNLSVTDANSCIVNSNTLSVTVNQSSNFSGTVTTNALPVAGTVVLYQYLPYYTKFDSVASQIIAANGSFNFVSFTSGIYIIKAIPTSNLLQIAYGDTAINWKTAKQIIHGCAVNDIQNIDVKPLGVFTATGTTGSLSGTIREGDGFGKRTGSEFKPTSPGNPIGGIIVKGGKNPGGQVFRQVVTPTTGPSKGTYTLSGLPLTTGNESYFIIVDIPGLDTNGTYHEVITITDINHQGLDFIIDSAKITPIPSAVISVNDLSAIQNQVKVFPNPATNKVTVKYNLQANSTVKIELCDVLGKTLKSILPETDQTLSEHSYTIELNDLSSGLYFLKLKINSSESIIKLVITE